MTEPSKHERVPYAEHPQRCQAMAGSNQCMYKRVDGSEYCDMHGGNVARQKAKAESQRMYFLSQWQDSVGKFAGHANLKSLREEIGILRMMLQAKLLTCKNDQDLMLRSSSISELIVKITKCVESCDRIDARIGQTLDKDQIAALGQEIIGLVSKHLTDPEVLKQFAIELVALVSGDPNENRTRTDRLQQN